MTTMIITAYMLVENLASGLYHDIGQCLMELIRNGLVASMNGEKWNPKLAKIEIMLVPNHPLCYKRGEPVLVVLDHGCGLTDAALVRYFGSLGTPKGELASTVQSIGAAQKGIGRLAALALNINCVDSNLPISERIKHGYYLFSRTAPAGDVRFVPIIPDQIEENRGRFDVNRFVSPDSTEMSIFKGIEGSFTAIVIPSPVFSNHGAIYEAIKYRLPREHDKMFELKIGGKSYGPAPLESSVNISSQDDKFRARLGVSNANGGVWLCDEETGLRVANCEQLGSSRLPDPIWYPGLTGDIFAPGLLKHQDTSRGTLNRDFTDRKRKNKEWQSLIMFLVGQVSPVAMQLIDRDPVSGSAAKALDEVVEIINSTFGDPDDLKEKRVRSIKPDTQAGGDTTKPPVIHKPRDTTRDRNKRHVSAIRIRDEVFMLHTGQSLHSFVFARVSSNNPKHIIVNVRGEYKALPGTKEARREHCLMQVLLAVGYAKSKNDPHEATLFANEVRSELLGKK